nr:hypothetical protein Q903MT_gene2885 [Picea sitchensis]
MNRVQKGGILETIICGRLEPAIGTIIYVITTYRDKIDRRHPAIVGISRGIDLSAILLNPPHDLEY